MVTYCAGDIFCHADEDKTDRCSRDEGGNELENSCFPTAGSDISHTRILVCCRGQQDFLLMKSCVHMSQLLRRYHRSALNLSSYFFNGPYATLVADLRGINAPLSNLTARDEPNATQVAGYGW